MGDPVGWCSWALTSQAMREYHDNEWGRPERDERALFEKICLESFQCGLSWATILARRQRLREVFANFEIDEVARFSQVEIDRLSRDPSIIRHRGKIAAVVSNAKACRVLIDDVGHLGRYLWSFAPETVGEPAGPRPPATSDEAIRLARDLKRRGWSFVGPTTMYAMMQSMGMVNDHDVSCPLRETVARERSLVVGSRVVPGIHENGSHADK